MFRLLKELRIWPRARGTQLPSEKDHVHATAKSEHHSETVGPLPRDVLKYWHKALREDYLLGLQSADVRIPLNYPHRLAWAKFNLGFGDGPEVALKVITDRAEKARLKREAQQREEREQDPTAASEPETAYELRIPMALVFHHAAKTGGSKLTYPDSTKAPPGDGAELKLPKLNIAFWFPFDLNEKNQICLPKDPFKGYVDNWPRMVRQWLEPQPLATFNTSLSAVGYFDSYRQALESFINDGAGSQDLKTYVEACLAVFDLVQADGIEAGLTEVRGDWIAVPREPSYATRRLLDVYECLPQASSIGALGQLISPGRQRSSVQVGALAKAGVLARHVAMVDKAAKADSPDDNRWADPLNDSQRRALHAVQSLESSAGVVAVSGPPGTGKTAMLRAMIANQWVLAACDAAQDCPVTLVCGATNQSVENVMGTFSGAAGECHPLTKRWLQVKGKPLMGFTASAPAQSKLNSHQQTFTTLEIKKNKVLITGQGVNGLGLAYNDPAASALKLARQFENAFERSKPLFSVLFTNEQKQAVSNATRDIRLVQKAADAAKVEPSPEALCKHLAVLVDVLHAGLRAAVARLADIESLTDRDELAAHFPGEGWASHWAEQALADMHAATCAKETQAARQKLLDVVWRPVIFQLAARYWETRWLATVIAEPAPANHGDALRRAAMLFPCIVATLHRAPALLADNKKPMFAFLDLLIIDEAGQAAPELGVPVLSLAKKAVVVGDMKQLSPVSSVTPEVDARQVLDRWPGEARLAELQVRGADSGTGSIMKLAATGASFAEAMPDGSLRDGLLLREHYRCAESIINVCIDLLYHDHDRDTLGQIRERELDPKIPDPQPGLFADAELPLLEGEEEAALRKRMKASFPLPPLGFYQTGGPNDEPRKDDSWSNPGEVEAIVDWLEHQGPKLAKWMARAEGNPDQPVPLAKLVAIVTPFRGQVDAIRNRVREKLDPLDKDLSNLMTIGTVHSLQGAEKPVILFSAVNRESRAERRTDSNHRERVFIDRDDGRLLNVAISRAQKSFILFGHSDLFFSRQAMNPANDLPSAIVGRCLAGVREPERERITAAVRIPARKLGPTTLMIVESAHKAKIIQALLPLSVQVFGCGGHIRDLPGAGTIRWSDGLKPRWQLSEREGSDLSAALRNAAGRLLQCEELVLGTDDDAQGEAIAWHMVQVLKDAPWFMHVKQVRRVRFHALTSHEMGRAFEEGRVIRIEGDTPDQRAASLCRALNMGLAYGAIALRVLDNLIGSVYLRHGMPGGGRVKGPLLRALAGHGDHPGTVGKRFGLAIQLQVNGVAVPARLMVLRRAEGWRGWGSDDIEVAQRLLAELPKAVVSPVPCLVEHEVRQLAPVEILGTHSVLQEAFRRFGWLPSSTMKLLQGLYELRPVADESDAQVSDNAWARLDQKGRLCLTESGQAQAANLLNNPVLERISANELLKEFDDALVWFSTRADAQEEDYLQFLRTWAPRFDDQGPENDSVLPVAGPCVPTIDAQGSPLALFASQPIVGFSSWEPCTASLRQATETPADAPEHALATAQQPASGQRNGAHGALVPLDIGIESDSPEMAVYSPHQRQLYELMSRLMLASSLRDGEINTVRRIYPLAWPATQLTGPVEIGVELITATPAAYRGWFDTDPAGLERHTGAWADAAMEAVLSSGLPPAINIEAQEAIRTRSLLEPTIDRLLGWMQARGLGRPSTFGKHIDGLMQGSGRFFVRESHAND